MDLSRLSIDLGAVGLEIFLRSACLSDLVEPNVEHLYSNQLLVVPGRRGLRPTPVVVDGDLPGVFYDLEVLKVAPRRFLLPNALAAYLVGFCRTASVSLALPTEVFTSFEEAETTLALWTPGTNDDFGSFTHARASARAL